jgi:hypothetical protein
MTSAERESLKVEYLNILADITIGKNLGRHKVTLARKIKSLNHQIKRLDELHMKCDGYVGVCNHYCNLQNMIMVKE